MATTVAADGDTDHPPSVPVVDLRLLSQSELYSLSLSSDDSFDLNRCDDVVIPKINRSVFNESAGSRKQTYSRLRLASADSSSTTTTLHRRTPHLRSTHTISSNNINDPEQAENSQIIRILKHLCESDPNFQDIVDNEEENDINSVVPEFMNSETLGIKRKRGRPRKHENVVFIRPPTAKRIRNNAIKKVVVYDHERDREIVNNRGVIVNVETLAGLEDPYGPEIRRRTLGMSTEDELLGFLRGLNGQWGSRRKKRRVVDASEFGDHLPKAWSLSLCIKKKEGRVWLFCRRYISPSGQQFESCKEISTYLTSVIGEENFIKTNHMSVNNGDNITLKEASVNAADPVLQEDIQKEGPINDPSSSSSCQVSNPPSSSSAPSLPTNHEEKVPMEIEDEMEVQIGRTDNDHIGSHMEDEIEKTEPSTAPPQELDCDTNEAPTSVLAADKPEPGTCVNLEPNSCKTSNPEELVHDLNIVSHSKQDDQIEEDRNILVEQSCEKSGDNCIINDDTTVDQSELLSVNEINREPETSGEEHVKCVDNKLDCSLDEGISSGSFLLSQFSNEQMGNVSGDGKEEISVCATEQVLNQDADSETRVSYVDTVVHEKSDFFPSSSNENIAVSQSLNLESRICEEKGFSEKEKVVGEPSSFGFFLDRFGLDKGGGTEIKKLCAESTRCIDSVKDETLISSQKQESSQKGGFDNFVNKLSTSSRLDAQFEVGRNTFVSYGASGIDNVNSFEEENEFRNHPSLTSWPEEEECENKNLGNAVSFSMDETRMQINPENVTKMPLNKPEEPKLDDFQIFTNNETKRNEGLTTDVLDFTSKSNLEFCSLVPSENEQPFTFQDDVTSLYDTAMEECKQDSPERGLLNHFSDDIFENKIYSTPLDGIKFDDDDRDISSNELSLAFGNPHGLYQDSKKDLVSCSKIDDGFDVVHTSLSMVNNNSMVDNLKTGRGSMGGLFNLSCNDKNSSFQNGGNSVYPGFKDPGNKFTAGFGRNHEVVPSGMWKTTGDGNQMQSGLSTSSSHVHIQPPSSFHSFNIMSDKAADRQFRLDERYNQGFGASGLRSSRPEPVEFSFLTGRSQHNPHPLQQTDSRVFSYNQPGMGQQFDSSSFWLGKNAMMPNTSARSQITSVCAWCRNEFHLQPPTLHSGTQDGIGSLCPSCSAGITGHVNML